MATFIVGDRKYEIHDPRGRNGRRATNWLIAKVGHLADAASDQAGIEAILAMTDDDEFLKNHLPSFVGKEEAKEIDDAATTGEMFNGVMEIVTLVMDTFTNPEVQAAAKNSNDTQGEEG